MYQCRFCNQEIENPKKRGRHVQNCHLNPNFLQRIEDAKQPLKERKLYQFTCKCGVLFELILTETEFLSEKRRKHCSRKCANARNPTEQTKEKTKNSLLLRSKQRGFLKLFVSNCVICNMFRIFHSNIKYKPKTCSRICYTKLLSQKLKGKTGGYRTQSGTSKFHGSWHRGVWMDSSWELLLAKSLDKHQICWERGEKFFDYVDIHGNRRKYYPDFFLPKFNQFVEIKGYWTPVVEHKIRDVMKRHNISLVILTSPNQIERFVDEVT